MMDLIWTFIRSPKAAASASKKPESLSRCLGIYALFLFTSMLFYWLKPANFPENMGPARPLSFWFVSMFFWQPFFQALSIALLLGLLQWFRNGSMAVKLVGGVAWAAFVLLINVVAYAQRGGTTKPVFALGALAGFAPFFFLLRALPAAEWRSVAAFMLGLSSLGLVQNAGLAPATLAGIPSLYKGVQIAVALWMLGAGTTGLRDLTGLRLPRAFLALFLSMFFLIGAAFTLHLLGFPEEALKAALLYG